MSETQDSSTATETLLSVVAGQPSEDELAALVAVFAAAANARRDVTRRAGADVSTAWNAPVRRMRPVVRYGPRAWRRDALPH